MKKSIYITAFFVLATAAAAWAQHISFIASFGAARTWNIPTPVAQVVYHDYYQYDWVHASQTVHHGRLEYNVILQRGNTFLELNIGQYGHVHHVRSFDYYPLAGHICGASCGYHEYYYNSFHVACNSHYHYGHNHVIYRPRPVNYVWGHYHQYPSYNKVVYNNTTVVHHGNKGHGYKKKSSHHSSNKSAYQNRDVRYVQKYPDRRRGNYDEIERERREKNKSVRTYSSRGSSPAKKSSGRYSRRD